MTTTTPVIKDNAKLSQGEVMKLTGLSRSALYIHRRRGNIQWYKNRAGRVFMYGGDVKKFVKWYDQPM